MVDCAHSADELRRSLLSPPRLWIHTYTHSSSCWSFYLQSPHNTTTLISSPQLSTKITTKKKKTKNRNKTKDTTTLKFTPHNIGPALLGNTLSLTTPFWPCRPPVLDTSSQVLGEDLCASACHTFPCNWSCHCITGQVNQTSRKSKKNREREREVM